MSKSMQKGSGGTSEVVKAERPTCLAVAEKGINSSQDLKLFLTCGIADVVAGRMSPGVANAATNKVGKLLKTVEMEYRYGTQPAKDAQASPSLMLTGSNR